MCKRRLVRARKRHPCIHENSSPSAQRSGPALQMSWAATLSELKPCSPKVSVQELNIEHSLTFLFFLRRPTNKRCAVVTRGHRACNTSRCDWSQVEYGHHSTP